MQGATNNVTFKSAIKWKVPGQQYNYGIVFKDQNLLLSDNDFAETIQCLTVLKVKSENFRELETKQVTYVVDKFELIPNLSSEKNGVRTKCVTEEIKFYDKAWYVIQDIISHSVTVELCSNISKETVIALLNKHKEEYLKIATIKGQLPNRTESVISSTVKPSMCNLQTPLLLERKNSYGPARLGHNAQDLYIRETHENQCKKLEQVYFKILNSRCNRSDSRSDFVYLLPVYDLSVIYFYDPTFRPDLRNYIRISNSNVGQPWETLESRTNTACHQHNSAMDLFADQSGIFLRKINVSRLYADLLKRHIKLSDPRLKCTSKIADPEYLRDDDDKSRMLQVHSTAAAYEYDDIPTLNENNFYILGGKLEGHLLFNDCKPNVGQDCGTLQLYHNGLNDIAKYLLRPPVIFTPTALAELHEAPHVLIDNRATNCISYIAQTCEELIKMNYTDFDINAIEDDLYYTGLGILKRLTKDDINLTTSMFQNRNTIEQFTMTYQNRHPHKAKHAQAEQRANDDWFASVKQRATSFYNYARAVVPEYYGEDYYWGHRL